MKKESLSMEFFRKLGIDSVAWSLRRLYCPVKKTDLVLEVGSGGNPYFRANVLCDAYLETQERFFAPLVYDRPTIIAPAENLPFNDDAFDFVIASHVLEHSADPERFLQELQRVGKAGYIEAPDAFMERLTHYGFHRLEITDKGGKLLIRKKKNYIQDQETVDLFSHMARPIFPKWVAKYPFHFHVRYYWSKDNGGIKYKIINQRYKFDWDLPDPDKNINRQKINPVVFLKQKTLFMVRKLFSQNKRNRRIDILKLMICGGCGNESLEMNFEQSRATCKNCHKQYFVYGLRK